MVDNNRSDCYDFLVAKIKVLMPVRDRKAERASACGLALLRKSVAWGSEGKIAVKL
jgi:hypothetical protein